MVEIMFFYKFVILFAILPAVAIFILLLVLDLSSSMYDRQVEKQKGKIDLFPPKK